MEKFKSEINPFIRYVKLQKITKECVYEIELYYDEVDEWHCIEIGGVEYLMHIDYDQKIDICLYELINNVPNYTESIPNELTIVLETSK
jgi:hypothetical protein